MKIWLLGMGMGTEATLTGDGRAALLAADAVLGASRLLEHLPAGTTPVRAACFRPEDILAWLEAHGHLERVCVVFSGDVGFYSGATALRRDLRQAGHAVESIAGISTAPYLCAKLGIPWQDVHLCSAHGVDCDVLAHVLNHPRCLFLTGGTTPGDICRALCDAGLGDAEVAVAERLSYPDERITQGTARNLADGSYAALATVLVRRPPGVFRRTARTGGIPDGDFLRGEVPMTKQEVRSVALAKLGLAETDTVWDVGAGTGSVAVEAALIARRGRVYAVEENPQAWELIDRNRERFGVYNLVAVRGTAPDALAGLPAPDAAFVGGTRGRLEGIVKTLLDANPAVRMVVSAVTLETMADGLRALESLGVAHVEAIQLSVSRAEKLGASHLLRAQNPIFLISGGGRA